jgi:two-component system nitrogen regulation response regulator GlnG
MSRILIADDEPSIRFVLREALERAGHQVEEAADGAASRARLAGGHFDLAFLDIRMPGVSGLDLLVEIQGQGPQAPLVVIMTAQNTFENAIEAMKRGAFDYLTKPFDLPQVEALVEKADRQRALRGEVAELRRQVGQAFRGGEALVGTSPAMVELFKTIGRIAGSDAAVLILGESGTGKELVARAIHYHSRRAERPFAALNMTALPGELIEAELFGHERGAFTGATEARPGRFRDTRGGTLLLDEIGDLPLELQAKLLRVLQEREVTPVGSQRAIPVDVRILAATHQDLEVLIGEGRFREDLYFRLNVVPIRIAPLRERKQDIPALLHHFVERFSADLNVAQRWPTQATIELLQGHDWPGNVRELENVVKRALVLASDEVLTPEDIEIASRPGRPAAGWTELVRRELVQMLEDPEQADESSPFWELVQRLERSLLDEALRRSQGSQIQAARLLRINRNTLRKKLVELGIDPQDR